MTPLTDALRALALHQDLPECAQAADEIERLRGLVEAAHKVWPKLIGATCSCGQWLTRTASDYEATAAHAAHVRQILDGGAR